MDELLNRDIESLSFKEVCDDPNAIIFALENSNLELEDSIKYFERATLLLAKMKKSLDEAKLKIQELSTQNLPSDMSVVEDI